MLQEDFEQLHKFLLETEGLSEVSDDIRELVEDEWPELVHKLPPKVPIRRIRTAPDRARSSRVKYLGFRPRRWTRRRLKSANRPSRVPLVLHCAFNRLRKMFVRMPRAPTEGAARGACLFLSRLALGKIAELERPRRHRKAFGNPSNSLCGTPSSVPVPPVRRMSDERSATNV
jgi:hypothetical protein